jgi:hypothetical protein
MEQKKYESVGGWLMLFCFGLIIGTPLKTLSNIGDSYNSCYSFFGQYPGLRNIFYVDSTLSLLIVVLSIRAGLALWFMKFNAIKIAKQYLLIYLCYVFISSFLPFFAGLPSEANDIMSKEIFKGLFISLFYVVIWYWYLNVSKRIKGTYSSPLINKNESDALSKINTENSKSTVHDVIGENSLSSSENEIQDGFGEFGLVKTNPIPIYGIDNIDNYMSQLRYETISKEGTSVFLPIQYQRTIENDDSVIGSKMPKNEGLVGSTFAPNIGNNIDVYNIYTFEGSKKLAKLYIYCYHWKTSILAPKGFIMNKNESN